jgi:hypothetical protein
MTIVFRLTLALCTLFILFVTNVAAAQTSDFPPVTDEMIMNPSDEDWLLYRRTRTDWGHSPLDQITKENVNQLQLVWSRAIRPGSNQMIPIVYNGVMYVTNAEFTVAIDVATGRQVWRTPVNFDPAVPRVVFTDPQAAAGRPAGGGGGPPPARRGGAAPPPPGPLPRESRRPKWSWRRRRRTPAQWLFGANDSN